MTLFYEDGSRTHFSANTFYVLINFGAYEHFEAPQEALKEAGRILKKDGIYFILLPSLGADSIDRKAEGW